MKYREVRDIDFGDYPGGYRDGVDAVLEYLDSLRSRDATDGASLIIDAISEGII